MRRLAAGVRTPKYAKCYLFGHAHSPGLGAKTAESADVKNLLGLVHISKEENESAKATEAQGFAQSRDDCACG